jgi:hypothetical protein
LWAFPHVEDTTQRERIDLDLDDRDVSAEELSTLLREERSGREPALPPPFPDRYGTRTFIPSIRWVISTYLAKENKALGTKQILEKRQIRLTNDKNSWSFSLVPTKQKMSL